VQDVLNEQQQSFRVAGVNYAMDWDNYHTLKEIQDWMTGLKSNDIITVRNEIIADTVDNNTVRVIVVTGTAGDKTKKQNIWIDGGIHANEWISPAVVTYMINELTNLKNLKNNSDLLEKYVWHFLPVQNPDGYAYTWTNRTDHAVRLWRKNRALYDDGWHCVGVDLNRNYGFQWNIPGGSSDWSCANNYRGPSAWSEKEVYETAVYIMAQDPIISLNFHSYGQVWATPWAYTNVAPPNQEKGLLETAKKAVAALEKVNGTVFEAKTLHDMIKKDTAGSSVDFIHTAGGRTNYAYGVELRDKGLWGMLLPADQIKPSGAETWAAVKTLARHVLDKGRLPAPKPLQDV